MKKNINSAKKPAIFAPKLSLEQKLTGLITFVALVSVLLGGIAVVVYDIFESEADYADKMTLIAKTAGNYAAVDIEFADARAALDSLSKLKSIPSILNAHLIDKKGQLFVSLNNDKDLRTIHLDVTTTQLVRIDEKLFVTTPIELKGKHKGYIQLITSTAEISDKILNHLLITALFGIILSIAVYFLARWVQGIISRPILSLAETATEFSKNLDYSLRVDYQANDEIGVLYKSFNNMLDTIQIEQQHTRNATDELKESEARFSAMFESLPDAIIFADIDRKIRLHNPAVEKMFQYSNLELIGNTTEMLYSSKEDFVEQGKLRFNKGARGVKLPYEVQHIRKDGSVFWTESLGVKVLTSSNIHIGYLSIMRDITDRKETESIIQEQQQEQKQILDAMADAVITVDEKGSIRSFNPGAVHIFSYTASEILGRNFSCLIPDISDNLNDCFENGDNHNINLVRELSGERKSGEKFPLRFAVAKLPKTLSGLRRFICTCQDISIQKDQEERLVRTQKMDALGKLTGGVAHDFNNMMAVVLGYSQLLTQMLDDNPDALEFVNEIHSAGERARDLTSKLLAFSRKRPVDPINTDINMLLNDSKLMLEKTLTARIHLQLDLTPDAWPVYLDKSSFSDTLLNLCINAMHAMPDGGTLTLSTKNIVLNATEAESLRIDSGNYFQLTISDTGTGIPEDVQKKLFEPFFTTKGEQGTGLGLSQVYGFIQQSKGSIQVFSTLGEGTQFVVNFPSNSDSITQKNKATPKNIRGNENILVIDDEAALVTLAKNILLKNGYQVFTANSSKEALEILQAEKIDVLLSDVIMPDVSGYQLAAQVKAQYPDIKIQLVSGFNEEVSTSSVDSLLLEHLLHKPYSSDELLSRLHDLLHLPAQKINVN